MRIFLAGAEQPYFRRTLFECGAKNVGVSFHQIQPRLPKTKKYILADRFDASQSIFLGSGGWAAAKGAIADPEKHFSDYLNFVEDNLERVTYVTEFDAGPRDTIEGWRRDFWDSIPPEKFVPVWHESYGLDELVRLCEVYENVGIAPFTTNITHRLNALVVRAGAKLHGLGIADLDLIRDVKFSSVFSSSWSSTMRFGDTIVWDGHRLRRYPAKMKEQARKRHRMLFLRAGFSPDLILQDDQNEVTRFTIWSWLQLEEFMSSHEPKAGVRRIKRPSVSTVFPSEPEREDPEFGAPPVATSTRANGNSQALERVQMETLPVFGFQLVESEKGQDEAGNLIKEEVRVPVLSARSQRQCSSCYLSASCPKFEDGAACAFNLPVEIRTKDQLLGSLVSLLEMQMQRVAFGRFAEDLEGGYPDPNLSNEMDRLFRMVESFKDIQNDSATIEMKMKVRGNAGMLSRIFGDRADVLKDLSAPLDPQATDQFLEDVIEGEVLD